MIDIDGLHGAYTFRSARAAFGDGQVRTAVETGQLIGFGRGVLLDARRVLDLRTRCAGAVLLTGGVGVIAGPTAAALHGCTAIGGFPVHVRVPYAHRIRSRLGLIVHQGDLDPTEVTMVDGLHVLRLDVMVADLLCTAARRAALACADEVLRDMRPEDRPGFVAEVTARLAERVDRRGTRQAAMLLKLATGLPETPAQSAFVLMLSDCGFPKPVCQYVVRGWRKVNFAWPAQRVALECRPTSAPDPRDADLRAQGWVVIRADEQDLVDPTAVYAQLRKALESRTQAPIPRLDHSAAKTPAVTSNTA
jgi:hypothetical protein